MLFLPAIIIGDHRQGRVGDLRLARAFGFAEVGHADDVVAEVVVGDGLGAGAEGRAFHIDIGAAVVDAGAELAAALEQVLPEVLADGVGEGDVGDDPAAEERVLGGLLGAVDELVDQDDVPLAKSFISHRKTEFPRPTASRQRRR